MLKFIEFAHSISTDSNKVCISCIAMQDTMFPIKVVLPLLSKNPVWKITMITVICELTFQSLYFLVILAPF